MNLTTTDDGGFQLHLDHPSEWLMVMAILHDANAPGFDLATAVGAPMKATDGWDDWSEWVLPDLREGFEQHLLTVAAAIEAARKGGINKRGVVVVPKAQLFDWYAALNQARLAMEAKYQFGSKPPRETGDGATERGAAYFRSQFYSFLQSYMLDRGLE